MIILWLEQSETVFCSVSEFKKRAPLPCCVP